MTIPAGNNLVIEVAPARGAGNWIVSVYKKRLLFKRRLSSDWFLDETQARKFAEQLAERLRTNDSVNLLKSRGPGWTLIRPPR